MSYGQYCWLAKKHGSYSIPFEGALESEPRTFLGLLVGDMALDQDGWTYYKPILGGSAAWYVYIYIYANAPPPLDPPWAGPHMWPVNEVSQITTHFTSHITFPHIILYKSLNS